MHYQTKLKNISASTNIVGVNEDSIAFVLSKIISDSKTTQFIHIAKDDREADFLKKQIEFFSEKNVKNNQLEVLLFPSWDCLPYDRVSPKNNIISARINCLHQLAKNLPKNPAKNPEKNLPKNSEKNSGQNNADFSKKTLFITTISGALQKTVPVNLVKNLGFKIAVGEEISIDILSEMLVDNGFSRSQIANNIAEFAIRGNIVDIIVAHNQIADDLIGYRLDFMGDAVENIKVFDPTTQITFNQINQINLLPIAEINLNQKSINNFRNNYRSFFGIPEQDMMYNAVLEGRNYAGIEHFMPLFYDQPLSSIFEYFEKPQISFSNQIFSLKNQQLKTIEEYYQNRVNTLQESKHSGTIYNPLPPQNLYLNEQEFDYHLKQNSLIQFANSANSLSGQSVVEIDRTIDLEIKPIPNFALAAKANQSNVFELLKQFLQNEFNSHKVIFACFSLGSMERLKKILPDHNISSLEIKEFGDLSKLSKNQMGLCVLDINDGFYASDIMLIGESALLGAKIHQRKASLSAERILSEGISLQVGDLVVHRYHGIGKFDGLHNIENKIDHKKTIKNDFLKIIYSGGDALFVLVEDINLITRYGSDNALVELDKLGGGGWQNRKEKVKKKIKIAAQQLIEIAAQRQIKKAPILLCQTMEYEEFKASFGFEETIDQLKAIAEIEEDLQKGSPMDRLVCGDVGFGKTEVAMRAAFIASHSDQGKYQVAIITPTTLLCRQHYHNFINRFKETEIKIAQLSRMVSTTEAKKIKQNLSEGKIDIVIGTHALLSKNIQFKKLGLLIVDEEQHFGVIQKERIKELKNDIHILSLSATPIPRTLQMSLSGLKELSIISTPPIDRMAVRNYVIPYDSLIIREAILREHQRGGKSFLVVPRISDINNLHDKLVRQIPEVKIEIAHGQMPASNLDKIMNDFYDGKFDVLLSTSIIESGIDVSSANTMIIYKAEHFGLAQLYQLRGRVGRGKIRGYCYFTTTVQKISEIAKKKLRAIESLDALGAGFSIASHDMDIRGSGNILGDEQSGQIRETGAELYQSMLNDAIKELKNSNNALNKNLNLQNQNQETQPEQEDYTPQIKLGISLLIPESYIEDLSTRMQFYKRIAATKNQEEQEQIKLEMIDRFGKMGEEIENLIAVANLKNECRKLGIEKLENNSETVVISFKNNHFEKAEKLLEMVFSSKNQIKLQGHKVLFHIKSKNNQEKLQNSLLTINKIASL